MSRDNCLRAGQAEEVIRKILEQRQAAEASPSPWAVPALSWKDLVAKVKSDQSAAKEKNSFENLLKPQTANEEDSFGTPFFHLSFSI